MPEPLWLVGHADKILPILESRLTKSGDVPRTRRLVARLNTARGGRSSTFPYPASFRPLLDETHDGKS